MLFFFFFFVFFYPNALGHPDNYINANSLSTPAHIVPEWYFLPFYAILRAIPDKLGGVLAMGGSLIALLFLPALGASYIRTPRNLVIYKMVVTIFLVNFLLLGWLGGQLVTPVFLTLSRICTFLYFFFFLLIPRLSIGAEFYNNNERED